jgi:DNA-binding IclR family transcriptional regulator
MGRMDGTSRTVARVVAVLEQLSVAPEPQSNRDLAQALGIPVSSMHRLMQKLFALHYVDCDADTARYSVAPSLCELGNRLAEVGGYSKPLQTLMSALRNMSGDTVTVWVPSGAHVRISALLLGKIRGVSSYAPGEMQEPFTTPGLAIATFYNAAQVRALIAQARRRRVPLGRRFQRADEVTKAIEHVRRSGYATGYNMKSDGWGILAWPLTITRNPLRFGALAIGSPVPLLRRHKAEIVTAVDKMLAMYHWELSIGSGGGPVANSRRV